METTGEIGSLICIYGNNRISSTDGLWEKIIKNQVLPQKKSNYVNKCINPCPVNVLGDCGVEQFWAMYKNEFG